MLITLLIANKIRWRTDFILTQTFPIFLEGVTKRQIFDPKESRQGDKLRQLAGTLAIIKCLVEWTMTDFLSIMSAKLPILVKRKCCRITIGP